MANYRAYYITLETWCKHCQLNVNLSKASMVHFVKINASKLNTNLTRFGNGKDVRIVNHYKYLGVYLDEHLVDFSISKFSDSGSKALGTIIGKFEIIKM